MTGNIARLMTGVALVPTLAYVVSQSGDLSDPLVWYPPTQVLALVGLIGWSISRRSTSSSSVSFASSGWQAVVAELERHRRSAQSASVLRLPLAAQSALAEARAGQLPHLRATDRWWVEAGSLYVLLVETADPRPALTRLSSELATMTVPDQARLASFPKDAVTSGALFDLLHPTVDTPRNVVALPHMREQARRHATP